MARHELLGGELSARAMLSAEPGNRRRTGLSATAATGETYQGRPLHDRQHPHDLFMELAAMYTRPIAEGIAVQLYLAPAGEPALGPVAFPHRFSAGSDPLAPIGHHWQDSTHISFGVLTAGILTRTIKLEGSWFNGREPDENRGNLDLRALDSFSGRLSINPTTDVSLQASYGYLKSPEEAQPDESLRRLTFSASYNAQLAEAGNWATTAVFGRNVPERERFTLDASCFAAPSSSRRARTRRRRMAARTGAPRAPMGASTAALVRDLRTRTSSVSLRRC
jgi:hypothetical protein